MNTIKYFLKLGIAQKRYKIMKLMKHIRDIGKFPKNTNYFALKAYYVNPLCKLAQKKGFYLKN